MGADLGKGGLFRLYVALEKCVPTGCEPYLQTFSRVIMAAIKYSLMYVNTELLISWESYGSQ